MKAYWLDASVILRFLTGDPPEMARQALAIFQRAAAAQIVLKLHPVTVAEVVYTLKSFYRLDLEAIIQQMLALLEQEGIEVQEREAVERALFAMLIHKISYADALLTCLALPGEGIATFDRDFKRVGVELLVE
jgi:predicted nucleic acid-binding protein